MAEVRPNGPAEPSVEMAEPVRFGRTTFLADRSFTKINKNTQFLSYSHFIKHKLVLNTL